MRTLEFRLGADKRVSDDIKINAKDHETHVLIDVTKGWDGEDLWIVLNNKEKELVKKVQSDRFIRLKTEDFLHLKLRLNGVPKEKIHCTLYLGNWAEMWLTELYHNMGRHLQSFDGDKKLSFKLGNPQEDHIEIYDFDPLAFRIVGKYKDGKKTAAVFFKGEKEAEMIKEMYRNVKKNCSDKTFITYQDEHWKTLQKNTVSLLASY
jgi:hypothetical protein